MPPPLHLPFPPALPPTLHFPSTKSLLEAEVFSFFNPSRNCDKTRLFKNDSEFPHIGEWREVTNKYIFRKYKKAFVFLTE